MSTYSVYVPATMEQGEWRFIAHHNPIGNSVYEDALLEYNSFREHDGQRPLMRMPNGTTYTKINK